MRRRKFISNISTFSILTVATPNTLFFPSTASSYKKTDLNNSIQLIRNATLNIQYAGKKILVDPLLSAKGAYNPFAGGERNPLVDLPYSVEEILKDLDLVIVTHTHLDHFDTVAKEVLPKTVKLVHQPANIDVIKKEGFTNTESIDEHFLWNGINIYRTGGKHGSGEILKRMGAVSGFVLQAEDHPTVYIIGDSIWTEEVEKALEKYQPDIIVANTGGALFPGFEQDPILMDEDQTILLLQASGKAKVIAVHMEALDHCRTTRASLQEKAYQLNFEEKLIIPKDGEKIML